jgi:hypothetical protein
MRYAALVCLLSPGILAQVTGFREFGREFGRRQVKLWRSPLEQPQRTAKFAVPLAAAATVLMIADQPTVNRYAQRPAPWAGKVSNAGDFSALAGSLGGIYAMGLLTRSETTIQVSQTGIMAVSHSFVLTQGLKALTRRQRPDGSNRWSMPSGHAMTAFAMAGAFSSHPRSPRWVRFAAPAVASAIAFSRIGARKHYPSDIAIGGTFGWLIGRSFARR